MLILALVFGFGFYQVHRLLVPGAASSVVVKGLAE